MEPAQSRPDAESDTFRADSVRRLGLFPKVLARRTHGPRRVASGFRTGASTRSVVRRRRQLADAHSSVDRGPAWLAGCFLPSRRARWTASFSAAAGPLVFG